MRAVNSISLYFYIKAWHERISLPHCVGFASWFAKLQSSPEKREIITLQMRYRSSVKMVLSFFMSIEI